MATLHANSRAKRARISSVLGLTIDASRIEGVELRRTNGSVSVAHSFSNQLSLNPLTAASELAGREIRNVLDAAGVRERKCVAGLPLSWVLTATIEIPDLPEADAASLLQLESEHAFPCDISTLQVVTLSQVSSGGKKRVLLLGVPKTNIEALGRALRAAKLQPVSFSLALSALQPPGDESSRGVVALAIGENNVGLQVVGKRGLIALRALEGGLELEGARRLLRSDVIARETRITLGQLPEEDRAEIRRIRVFGSKEAAHELADELDLKFDALKLDVEVATRKGDREHGFGVPPGSPVNGAFSLATAALAGNTRSLEFLPPEIKPWERMARKYASGRLRVALAAAILILLVPACLFGYQQWQLTRLQSQWNQMSGKVKELEAIQARIRQFRPWYDESFRSLNVLKQLTAAFPGEGTVSARSVEFRTPNAVTCTGQARDSQSLLATIGKLRASPAVSDVKVSQIRGRSPTQFTFDFRWQEGGQSQ